MIRWVKTGWKLIDGHKRDIAGLFANGYATILAYWHVGSDKWIYMACASFSWLLITIGWAHAGMKGDMFRDDRRVN